MKKILLSLIAFLPMLALSAHPLTTSDKEETAPTAVTTTPDDENPLSAAATEMSRPPRQKNKFLPTRHRIDREINKIKFAYKGEVMLGMTASYGTLSSDDTDFMLILDNLNADGTIATIRPFVGYFYSDNHCLGFRFGYNHVSGNIDNARLDFGEINDINGDIPYIDLTSNNYSFGIFHRSYAGLDPKGRFGLFAELELAVVTGKTDFAYDSGDERHRYKSDNVQVKLAFNPGVAVYLYPNVCATLSFGLGGLQYTNVSMKDPVTGVKIGSRKASKMKFKLNIAAINIGMTVHLWNKKKE